MNILFRVILYGKSLLENILYVKALLENIVALRDSPSFSKNVFSPEIEFRGLNQSLSVSKKHFFQSTKSLFGEDKTKKMYYFVLFWASYNIFYMKKSPQGI